MLLCVVLAAVAALIRYPQAVVDMTRTARDNAALSYSDREIAGGNTVLPDQAVMYQARARIPETDAYEVLVGEPRKRWKRLTQQYAPGYSLYFLLPRRQAIGARWVICFNCGLGRADGEVVWRGEGAVSILRRPE